MPSKSKWIKELSAEDALARAAALALGQRLPLVWHYLPLAAEHSAQDGEYVHQLRVTTRRAAAAIEVFADALPKRRTAWMTRRLKHIRRAAGEARDLDVLAERIARDTCASQQVLDAIRQQRAQAQEPIIAIHEKLGRKKFSRRVEKLLERTRWRGEGAEPTLAAAARRVLEPIAVEFFRQTRADLTDASQMHRLRKVGKRLRYAMELLASAYEDSFRTNLYPQVEEVQEKLGQVNDRHAAQTFFESLAESAGDNQFAAELADLANAEKTATLVAADAFRGWFDAKRVHELEEEFAGYIAGGHFQSH